MRIPVLIGSITAATILGVATAPAGSDRCCTGAPPFPQVIRAMPRTPFVIPPTGYVLDPADARRPFYVVNSPFGVGFAAPTYARPTFSEGGYAFADDFPDVLRYGASSDPFDRPFGAPPYTAYRYRPAPNARIIHLDDN
jgi:hypothetical protein